MRVNLRAISEAAAFDPKRAILDKIERDIAGMDVFHNLVLVASYVAPPRTMKGPNGENIPFYETDKKLDEHRFQGKVGMVLKMGPLAFRDDKNVSFGGDKIEVGDWVVTRPSDGLEWFLSAPQAKDGVCVRVFEDTQIKARVPDPSMIY